MYTGHCVHEMSRHDNHATYSSERYSSLHTDLKQTGCAVDTTIQVTTAALHLLQVMLLT